MDRSKPAERAGLLTQLNLKPGACERRVEAEAFPRKPLEVRRADVAVAVGSGIVPREVVGEEEDDVGARASRRGGGGLRARGRACRQSEDEQKARECGASRSVGHTCQDISPVNE